MNRDAARIDRELSRLPMIGGVVGQSAAHLLGSRGKRLRPLLVAVASRLGSGFDDSAASLAVAVELVHSATLLHDDVVDLGDRRRGAPAARVLYGNAASIFAGDWLLIEALRRVRASRIEGVLDRLLSVIEEMIAAESIQLARRGRIEADRAAYFRIAEGKTASLFSFALFAGARAGGLGAPASSALEAYGRDLGVAFQIMDDVRDFAPSEVSDKTVFADLREGKITYPLIIALERDRELNCMLADLLRAPDGQSHARIVRAIGATGAFEQAQAAAVELCRRAESRLHDVPEGEGRDLLTDIARAVMCGDPTRRAP
jgi:octaprenyl-diphosphate synthase